MTYEDLLIEAESNGLIVKEKPLRAYKGRIKGNRVAIKMDINNADKKCTLVEELGHYHTTIGDILDQRKVENRKQERKARAWAYEQMVPLHALLEAYWAGINTRYELAEFLDVTEPFLQDSLDYYREKYGEYYAIDNYLIYFDPLVVVEIKDRTNGTNK